MHIKATLVLPADVGAHTNIFFSYFKAYLQTLDWITFNCLIPSKTGLIHAGKELISISFSFISALLASMVTSSYPGFSSLVALLGILNLYYCFKAVLSAESCKSRSITFLAIR